MLLENPATYVTFAESQIARLEKMRAERNEDACQKALAAIRNNFV